MKCLKIFWDKLDAAHDKPTLFPTLQIKWGNLCITKRYFSSLQPSVPPYPFSPPLPLLTHILLPTCWEELILARDGKLYFRLNGKTQFHLENWNRWWHFRRVHLWLLVFCLMPISYLYYSSVIYHPGIKEQSAFSISQCTGNTALHIFKKPKSLWALKKQNSMYWFKHVFLQHASLHALGDIKWPINILDEPLIF